MTPLFRNPVEDVIIGVITSTQVLLVCSNHRPFFFISCGGQYGNPVTVL